MLTRFFSSQIITKSISPAPERLELVLAGQMRSVLLRRTAKTQRYTLRLKPSTRELVVTMPPRGTKSAVVSFLTRHEGWLETRLNRLPDQVEFTNGAIIPFQGDMVHISHNAQSRGTVWIEPPNRLAVAGKIEHISRRVTDFLKKQAKQELNLATHKYATQLNVSITRITIKDTTSRWGSCSSTGAIAYSWRIIMAPPYVLDYLAAHEVAHRREMNHSARFWTLLRDMCSETDRAEIWLKTHGRTLHNYG
jgi:predicted metal-dependent hydrolase